jgi:mono/diheme cytochrome c family protein
MTLRQATALATGLLAAAALGACGEQRRSAPSQATSGREVFAQAGCAGCHELSAAGASGRVGPSLDEAKPSAAEVEAKVRRGGGGMPAFEGRLSDQQIKAVAGYVAGAAGRGSP